MKKKLFLGLALICIQTAGAQVKTTVKNFLLTGPYAVAVPFSADTVDVQGKKFDEKSLLRSLPLQAKGQEIFRGNVIPSMKDAKSVGMLSFFLNNNSYLTGKITVKGPRNYQLYVDGQEASADLKLAPEHHTIAIRYLAAPQDTDSIRVTIDAPITVVTTTDERHPYMVSDLTDGRRVRNATLSADGRFVALTYQTTEAGGRTHWEYEVRETKTNRLLVRPSGSVRWMPRSAAYIEEVHEQGVRVLYKVDPLTGSRMRWTSAVPEGSYSISPTEDFLIVTATEEGPKEDREVFQVLEMDDRQPGWRSRTYLVRHEVASGLSQRITFGTKNQYLADISANGNQLLVMSAHSRLSRRPTEVVDVFILDIHTLKADTVFQNEGFIGRCLFSPDGRQLLVTGTPEAFERIGCQLPAEKTPSMTENELFLYNTATRETTPLTRDFDPSISEVYWSQADGNIYFSAEDRDYVRLFVLNPKTRQIVRLNAPGDEVISMDFASQAPMLAYLADKTLEPASAYLLKIPQKLNAGKKHSSVSASLHPSTLFNGADVIAHAEVGTCKDWNFQNSKGDTVYGRLYLPTDFDASKKYPMIVYYYGGCSPVSRFFESRYPAQYWTSLGYVAYILQPSGATGFGQEWASRHVNTAGQGPAEDIIEGTKQICASHPFIDAEHIGCMGASYGGFMTQYIQTRTDLFAAAVSHAGITNHTSYWGQGYWGYNYSEVSMANSYPWSHRHLYVDQSPLFNADKIHTPLLLLHGTADTNVPIVESLQMFTALKLLGREVALVEVEGENHHILDYGKRKKWMATQMAWFQKWLKGDSTWWDALYPKKNL